jgi:hypothetical protein
VNVRRFLPVAGIEKEPVGPATKDGWHQYSVR